MEAIIFIICLSLMVTQMIEPLQNIKYRLNLLYPEQQKSIIRWAFVKLINCSKCFSFWFSLIFFQSFVIAVIIAVTTELINRNLIGIKIK
jgi:hypothetical protein